MSLPLKCPPPQILRPGAATELEAWFMEGKLKNRETFEMGLENAGKAFVSMIGKNIG
jgi:NADPH-dependent curcumin reductase CurA